jgi:hypothetical protein
MKEQDAGVDDMPLIRQIGRALFGERWVSALAHELGINPRTARRWADGTSTPRPGVYADLARLLKERSTEISKALEALDERQRRE